jgi:type II secretory pathway pseudopilin PulG
MISSFPVRGGFPPRPQPNASSLASGFTMIEIALCLAIIGFALVAIIGVLPLGMNTQRNTREETIIGQDATMLLEAIRNGERGLDDLTNNVYAIVVTNGNAVNNSGYINPVLASAMNFSTAGYPTVPGNRWYPILTNGANIVGLLSTPEYTDAKGNPVFNPGTGPYTNYIRACVSSFSGLAAEKPPQTNQIMQADAFSYQIYCVNAPMAADTNALINSGFARQLAGNLREIRLLFLWPQLPNGGVGGFSQIFRASVSGQIFVTTSFGQTLYFYQSQTFTNTP